MPRRPVQSMPDDIQKALEQSGMVDRYMERPFYQRNDYLAWIKRAAKDETRLKRTKQMLSELDRGGVYMGMDHPPSRR